MKILIGFFVGVLCGVLPLVFGLLIKNKLLGIIGIVSSSLSGVLFAALDKSPFTAIGISIVFIIALFANHKRKKMHDDDMDNDENMNDE